MNGGGKRVCALIAAVILFLAAGGCASSPEEAPHDTPPAVSDSVGATETAPVSPDGVSPSPSESDKAPEESAGHGPDGAQPSSGAESEQPPVSGSEQPSAEPPGTPEASPDGGSDPAPSTPSASSSPAGSAPSDTAQAPQNPGGSIDMNGRVVTIKANWYIPDKFSKTTYGKDINKRVQEINEKFNCEIKFTPIDWGTHEVMMVAGQPGCDILCIGSPGLMPFYTSNNMLYELDNLGVDFNAAYYDKTINETLKHGGKTYAVKQMEQAFEAIRFQSAMFFNKNILKNRGIDPDSIYTLWKNNQWTWDKFEEMARKVSSVDANNDGVPDIFGTLNAYDDSQLWVYLIQSNGSDVVKNTSGGVRLNIDDPKAVKALEFWQKLARENTMLIGDSTATAFTQGKVAFVGTYIDRIENQQGIGFGGMKDDFGVAPFPMGPDAGGKYRASVSYYDAYSIPSTALRGDTNDAYAKQLAAIIDAMCKPIYETDKENSNFKLQVESVVRDRGSMDVLSAIRDYRFSSSFYQVYEVCLHPLFRNVLEGGYAGGLMDTNSLLQTYMDVYNQMIIDAWR